jgi:hypothetical protein
MGKRPEQKFFQLKHTNGQKESENVFSITNHERNANENHEEEVSPCACEDGHQNSKDKCALLAGM